jgi:N-acyl-D-aspartate/D-glutamate deacylase
MHDLTIRNGTIVDGTGGPAFQGDIAIDGNRITSVGPKASKGREEIDARGALVTPGFVDIHTHYDAQAIWDPVMAPSAWHGVTSVVMGNCGVGFAPAAPEHRQQLLGIMEGVENIPSAALAEGMPFTWETFPEYLDALAAIPRTVDVGTHVPHVAVRNYVMGPRGWDVVASSDDIRAMVKIVEEGLRAGALGFSTNRYPGHQDLNGVSIPGTYAAAEELVAFGAGMQRAGHGVFEVALDPLNLSDPAQWAWMREISTRFSLPVSYELVQPFGRSDEWRRLLALTDDANKAGANIRAQVSNRSIAFFLGWQLAIHPFQTRESWKSIEKKPWAEQLKALKDPAFKARLLSEEIKRPFIDFGEITDLFLFGWEKQYLVTESCDYEPGPEASISGVAAARGRDPAEFAYDAMMADEGRGVIYVPLFNYSDGNLDAVAEMLNHRATVLSLSDGGAHCLSVCDASLPTFGLTHWVRDRKRNAGAISVETAVKWQTQDTATLYDLNDRGRLQAGLLADVNVIDFARLQLQKPYVAHDFPAGCARLLQKAVGYVVTVKSGAVTFREGEPTGARPGGVIRGPQGERANAAQRATAM